MTTVAETQILNGALKSVSTTLRCHSIHTTSGHSWKYGVAAVITNVYLLQESSVADTALDSQPPAKKMRTEGMYLEQVIVV